MSVATVTTSLNAVGTIISERINDLFETFKLDPRELSSQDLISHAGKRVNIELLEIDSDIHLFSEAVKASVAAK